MVSPEQLEQEFFTNVLPLYDEIPGWFPGGEAAAMYSFARVLPADATCVEIGSWQGKSAVVIASALKATGGDGELWCIDPFNCDGDPLYLQAREKLGNPDMLDSWKKNIKAADLEAWAYPIRGYSNVVWDQWTARPDAPLIDLLFIDGDHRYAGVKRDILQWGQLVKPGGIMALHDVYFNLPPEDDPTYGGFEAGPAKAITEVVLPNTQTWGEYTKVGTLFFVRKKA